MGTHEQMAERTETPDDPSRVETEKTERTVTETGGPGDGTDAGSGDDGEGSSSS